VDRGVSLSGLTPLVKKYIKGYSKGYSKLYEQTKQYLPVAIDRSKKVLQQQEANGTDNPSTRMHELMEYLDQIKK